MEGSDAPDRRFPQSGRLMVEHGAIGLDTLCEVRRRAVTGKPQMTIGGSQLLHRLVGLILAVAMPVCCCTTSLFGDAVLGDDCGVAMVAAGCCSGVDVDERSEPGTNDRCDCVRGFIDAGACSATTLDALETPPIAHPLLSSDPGTDPNGLEAGTPPSAFEGPPDPDGSTPTSRRLRSVVLIQR